MSKILALPARRDVVASLGIFTVAIPLSLGIALASGVPASSALVSAIIGGVIVGALSGAPLVVSGPAAGLAALVLQYVQVHGLRGLAVITVLAGVVQIALGVARLGRLFTLVPKPVLQGMLAAIGVMIALSQLHVLLGASVPASVREAIWTLPSTAAAVVSSPALQLVALLGCVAVAVQLLWPRIAGRFGWLPGALPAVILVTLVGLAFELPRVALGSLVGETVQAVSAWWTTPPSFASLSVFVIPALALALVASAETLLTARAVDTLAESRGLPSKASLDRELIAQGTGNAVAGFLGGMPLTGVIVRSAANINFGATTRWSAILHGIWVALAIVAFPFVVTAIPLTALAAVLVVTGFKLLSPAAVVETFRTRKSDGMLWLVTFGAILATDLLRGLGTALVVAALVNAPKILRSFGRKPVPEATPVEALRAPSQRRVASN